MISSRRDFLKISTVGGVAASVFGFDLQRAYAQVRELKSGRTTETRSTGAYCAVSCGVIIHTLGDKARNVKATVVHIEGDPDHPINRGTLCSKGITLKQNIVNDRRITMVRYRAPGSDHWEDKSWDWALDRIAHLLKKARDEKLIEKDDKGRTVNALTAVGVIGGGNAAHEKKNLLLKILPARLRACPLDKKTPTIHS